MGQIRMSLPSGGAASADDEASGSLPPRPGKAGRVYDAGDEICNGSHPDQRAFRDSGLPMFFAIDGVIEHGIQFFELMRRHKMTHLAAPGQPTVYAIGGHLDLTVIASNGAESVRIHHWPDEIGKKIDPFAYDAIGEAA